MPQSSEQPHKGDVQDWSPVTCLRAIASSFGQVTLYRKTYGVKSSLMLMFQTFRTSFIELTAASQSR